MARGRFISKQITIDTRIASLSSDTSRLLFTWLIPHLDVDGKITGTPSDLKWMIAAMLPHVTTEDIERYIREWVSAGMVIWYEVKGTKVLMLPNFNKHNDGIRKDRESPSIFPEPPQKVWDSWNIRRNAEEKDDEGVDLMPVEDENKSAENPAKLRENSGKTPAQVKLSKVKDKLSEVKLSGAENKNFRDIQAAWEAVNCQLQMDLSKANYEQWVKDTKPMMVDDNGNLVILCKDQPKAEWLNNRMKTTVARILHGIDPIYSGVMFTNEVEA